MAQKTPTFYNFSPIEEDCILLKQKFLSKHSSAFSDFKASWDELSFYNTYQIISKKNSRCKVILIDKLYNIGMEWLTATPLSATPPSTEPQESGIPTTTTSTSRDGHTPSSDHSHSSGPPLEELCEKLAGLYLLWSIFYTQAYQPPILIRATLKTWKDICCIHDLLRKIKHYEGDYIISQLKADSAFLICYTSIPMCIPVHVNTFSKDQLLSPFLPSSSKFLTSLSTSVVSQMEDYFQLKQQLSSFLPHHLLNEPSLTTKLKRLSENQ